MNDPTERLRCLRIVQAHAAHRPARAALAGVLVVGAAAGLHAAERLLGVPAGALLAARVELAQAAARGQLADVADADEFADLLRPDDPGGHPSTWGRDDRGGPPPGHPG